MPRSLFAAAAVFAAVGLGGLLTACTARAQAPASQEHDLHASPAPDAAPAQGHDGIDAQHYRFAVTLREESDRISGVATARVRFLSDTLRTFALDLVGPSDSSNAGMTVASVERVGGGEAALDFRHADNRLRITLEDAPEQDETRAFRIRYSGVPADGLIIAENQFGDRTFFGDHWPTRARHYLPSIDHPADKATVAFEVTAPDAYQIIASGRLEERTDRPGPTSVTRYRSAARLPMKVAVFGAARFAVGYPGVAAATPLESWVYPQSRSEGFDEMALAGPIVEFFAANVGPFPFEKLANVESKTRYGGMENAGSIFYSEGAVAEGGDIEPLVAHEVAHQWFGDAVTEASYAHLWLSEGFATYLTDLYIEDAYGEARFRERMRSERRRLARYAQSRPAAPLVDARYDEPTELLDPFRYQKGAWVLHMLRRTVGDAAFWDGLQRQYRQYRGGNADTHDFRRTMEAASGRDLGAFFAQWTQAEAALPRYEGTWRYEPANGAADSGGRVVVELEQRMPADFTFALPLEVGIYPPGGGEPRIETVEVNARQAMTSFAVDEEPARVALDPYANTLMTADFARAE